MTTVPLTQPNTYRILHIVAWGIAILISASILAVGIAFFVFLFWVAINS